MSLLNDFWTYCSCYEIPRNFALWSGLGLLSAVINRKCYTKQGDIRHSCTMYICLVADQGEKKSTAKDFARDCFAVAFPNRPMGAAMQTREEIVKFLASEESTQSYRDEIGALVEYHPYPFFINELKNFLSFNPAGMIEFLTDIYDREYFDVRTLKRDLEVIQRPALTILACETPKWLVNRLKADIITGGFSRRMVYVYEIITKARAVEVAKPRPVITQDAREALKRVIAHVKRVDKMVGEFKWGDGAEKFFDDWYMDNLRNLPDDPVMRGYKKTKDVQLLKTCMLCAAAEPKPQMLITVPLLEQGLALTDAIELNMPKLSIAAGRNELAAPQQRLLEMIEENGGKMNEKEAMRKMGSDLNPMEVFSLMRFLKDSELLLVKEEPIPNTNLTRPVLMTREYVRRHMRSRPAGPPRETGEGHPQT